MNDANEPSGLSLDIDALTPPVANIKYKGQDILVQPLDVPDYAKVMEFSNRMTSLSDVQAVDPAKLIPILTDVKAFIVSVVPELQDIKLNPAALMTVLEFLIMANSPSDKAMEELKKRGIEYKQEAGNAESPKEGSTLSEPLPSSSEATPVTEPTTSPTAQ